MRGTVTFPNFSSFHTTRLLKLTVNVKVLIPVMRGCSMSNCVTSIVANDMSVPAPNL